MTKEEPAGLSKEKTGNGQEAKGQAKKQAAEELCPTPEEPVAASVNEKSNNGVAKGKATAPGQLKKAEHDLLKLSETTTRYLYDGFGLNVLNEYKDRTAPKAAYTYANGQVLARKMFGVKGEGPDREPGLANGGTYYYLTDGLGSVTDLTDQHGEVVRQYRYDSFGGLFTGSVGLYNTTGLTGKTYDAKAGLMDYSARWYDPAVGRFTQRDTFFGWQDLPQSLHRYAYVHNNPVNLIDPTGHSTEDIDPGEGGGTGGTSEPAYFHGDWRNIDRVWEHGTIQTEYTKTNWSEADTTAVRTVNVFLNGVWDHSYEESGSWHYRLETYYEYDGWDWIYKGQSPSGDLGPQEDDGPTREELEQQARQIADTEMFQAGGEAPATATVTVQSGDSLSKVAAANNLTLNELLAANPQLTNPNVIYPGQVLNLPAVPGSQTTSASVATHSVPGEFGLVACSGVECGDLPSGGKSAEDRLREAGFSEAVIQNVPNLELLMQEDPEKLAFNVQNLNNMYSRIESGAAARDDEAIRVAGTGLVIVGGAVVVAATVTVVVPTAAVTVMASPTATAVITWAANNGDDMVDAIDSCSSTSGAVVDGAVCAVAIANVVAEGDQPSAKAVDETNSLPPPDFVVTPQGVAIPVPDGAQGPNPVNNGKGFQFEDGAGGKGLDKRVTDVRIMDPREGKGSIPAYPDGYVVYGNATGQAVDPYTGKTASPATAHHSLTPTLTQ